LVFKHLLMRLWSYMNRNKEIISKNYDKIFENNSSEY